MIGAPTSAGALAPGQEQAPAALRGAGLLDELRRHGLQVHDHGDGPRWRWRPDRGRPRAQNMAAVLEIASDTARRAREAASAGELTLVLGGDCTVGIGTVAGHLDTPGSLRLAYFDAHADLNVPASRPRGSARPDGHGARAGEEGRSSGSGRGGS